MNKFIEELGPRIRTLVLASLIKNDLIDKSKLNDKEYVMSQIIENFQIVKDSYIQITSFGEFRNSIISEILANRTKSAIMLTGVCIENILNIFYHDLLSIEFCLTTKEVLQAINRLSIPDKIGWFLNIATGCQLSQQLKEDVMKINSIRNEIVHYQAIPRFLDDSNCGTYEKLENKIQNIKVDNLERITQELEVELEEIFNIVDPTFKQAEELYRNLF